MRILGIDPGYDRLGIAVIDKKKVGKEELLFSECFETKRTDDFEVRLRDAGAELTRVIKEWRPEFAALETLFFSKNIKTAMHVAEARGMILYIIAAAGITLEEYSPQDIKIAVTGYGKSDKAQIISMIPRLIEMKKSALRDDEYDAIAVALTASCHKRFT